MVNNLHFLPFPELTSRRFVLRELNDADALLIHTMRSDQETNALIGRENSKSIEDAVLFIDRIKTGVRQNKNIYWVICFENSPDLTGTVGLWNFDIHNGATEIGYELLHAFRGQGIMSEVLPTVIQYAFGDLKLKRINAFCSDQNIGSIKLLKKCGFRLASSNDVNPGQQDPGMLSFVLNDQQTL